MNEPVWVLPEVVIAVQQMLIAEHGGLAGLRDEAMLDSALNRAKQRFTFENNFSIYDLAASYSYGLIKNHSFIDGNKRIALTVAVLFLELNGHVMSADEAETVVTFNQLADGKLSENELAIWYDKSSTKIV